MMQSLRKSARRIHLNQEGQILSMVLIFMVLGALLITPLLAFMGTGFKTNLVYDARTGAIYAADSGVEDAKWKIQFDQIPDFERYNFGTDGTHYSYDISDTTNGGTGETINDCEVKIEIQSIWVPEDSLDISSYSPEDMKNIAEVGNLSGDISGDTGLLMIEGAELTDTAGPHNYQLVVNYKPGDEGDIAVTSIGIWLPKGFSYDDGSCILETKYGINKIAGDGGTRVVFDMGPAGVSFNELTGDVTLSGDWKVCKIDLTIERDASIPINQNIDAVSWITTGNNEIPFAWDDDIRYYRIVSTALLEDGNGVKVEAITAKNSASQLASTINGDYVAIGNTLMDSGGNRVTGGNNDYYLDRLFRSSSATLGVRATGGETDYTKIPEDAILQKAYLYWSGWQEGNLNQEVVLRPSRDSSAVPSSSWMATPTSSDRYTAIDDVTTNDADYLTGTNNGSGRALFGYTPSESVSEEKTIYGVTVYFRARDASSGSNNIRAAIEVDGRLFEEGEVNPSGSWETYSHTFRTNPATGKDWTADDFDPSSPGALQEIGVSSTDLNPGIRLSMVYAVVHYRDIEHAMSATRVNQVKLGVNDISGIPDIIADKVQIQLNTGASDEAWSYSCFKDITWLLKDMIDPDDDDDNWDSLLSPNGSGEYTLGHIVVSGTTSETEPLYNINGSLADRTRYPLSIPAKSETLRYQYTYAGWSIIFIYSSSQDSTAKHQIYLFDEFQFTDVGGDLEYNISGFLVPENAKDSHLTYFVGDGDTMYKGERLTLNGDEYNPNTNRVPEQYSDPLNPWDDFLNSQSNALTDTSNRGIDIDTFDISDCLKTGDTSARIKIDHSSNNLELFNLVYLIISFNSEITSGGSLDYLITNP